MIKERNANIVSHNKKDFAMIKEESPFTRSNPYRVKAEFYSERKKSSTTTTDKDSNVRKMSKESNPESLKYRRNYKENPPSLLFEYRKMNDNYMQVKNNMLTRNLSRGVDEEMEEQEYRLRLKQFVADKFCPSDPYLEIVKDKFTYFSAAPNSEFQNVMKMSNLGISSLANSKYTPQSTLSYKDKLNPFYRKNLISSSNRDNEFLYESLNINRENNKWEYFPEISNTDYSRVSNYQYYSSINAHESHIYHDHMNSNVYQISIPPPSDPKHKREHRLSTYSEQSASRISQDLSNHDNLTAKNNNPSPKSLEASFGPDYNWKDKGVMRPFIDAVIEHHIDDMLQIQSQAPKSIRIKGKTFHLNPVHRITK